VKKIHVIFDGGENSFSETRRREIAGLLEASKVTECDNLLIITNDEEAVWNVDGKTIKVTPAWKWLLNCPSSDCKNGRNCD